MDFGALPPEINSAQMYSGPGAGSMLTAASAWGGLAAELHSGAAAYTSVISGLTSGPWLGPSSTAMAAAAAPYLAWMTATAGQAEQAATQAQAAAGAYATAFAMTVPPPVIAANRAQLMTLTATNFFGQNTPAIATNEAQYSEMWAQDAAAMYDYAANSAAITTNVTPTTPPPQTTNSAGLATQSAAVGQAAGTTAGQTSLSQLINTISTALQGLASPSSSAASTSGLSGILNALGLTGSSAASSTPFSGDAVGSVLQSLVGEYLYLPGFFGMFAALDAIAPVMSNLESMQPMAALTDEAEGAAVAEAAGAADAGGVLGSGFEGGFGEFADVGGMAGLGQAASIGPLSVPPSWGWAATAPPELLGGVPLMMPDTNFGAQAGMPMILGGLPRAAGAAAAAGDGGTAAAKYGPRLRVMPRPPAAGYPPNPAHPPPAPYPIPAGLPPAVAGYRPAIVYLPTNGHAPAHE